VLAFSQATTITISVAALVALIAVLVLLRLVLRKDPSPPSWRRYRIGIFIERDPREELGEADRR